MDHLEAERGGSAHLETARAQLRARPAADLPSSSGLAFSIVASRTAAQLTLETERVAAAVRLLAPPLTPTGALASLDPLRFTDAVVELSLTRLVSFTGLPPPTAVATLQADESEADKVQLVSRATPDDLVLALVSAVQADALEHARTERLALSARHAQAFAALLHVPVPFSCPSAVCVAHRPISLSDVRTLGALVALTPDLSHLDVADTHLCELGASLLLCALPLANTLHSLSLSANMLGSPGPAPRSGFSPRPSPYASPSYSLDPESSQLSPRDSAVAAIAAELLRPGSVLTALNLSHCHLGDEGAIALGNALRRNDQLTNLNLSANQITDSGAAAFAALLKQGSRHAPRSPPSSYRGPSPHPCGQSERTARADSEGGQSEWTVRADSEGGQSEWTVRADSESPNGCALESLDLSSNFIGAAGADALAVALYLSMRTHGCRLHSLALFRNKHMPMDTALLLVRAASRSVGLEWVSASHSLASQPVRSGFVSLSGLQFDESISLSSVREPDARLIAHDLRKSVHLKSVRLSGSRLSDSSALALAAALSENNTLTELDLMGNALSNAAACALGNSLRRNCSLQHLNLRNNVIADDGASALAAGLANNISMRSLQFSQNRLADGCAEPFAAALRANTALTTLFLDGNLLSASAMLAIHAAWGEGPPERAAGTLCLSAGIGR